MKGGDYVVAGILIDELNPNFTWEKTAVENEWCSGSGTQKEPYVIESVYINGNLTASLWGEYIEYSCILIRNSDKYFIIRNCILERSGVGEKSSGIILYNSSNGLIADNTCKFNLMGITVNRCGMNITLQGNTIMSDYNATAESQNSIYGLGFGIAIIESNFVIIKENDIRDVVETINIFEGTGNYILNNVLLNQRDSDFCTCLRFYNTNATNVEKNDIVGFKNEYMVSQVDCAGNVFDNNTIDGVAISGSAFVNYTIGGSSLSTASSFGKPEQILLDSSNHNSISNNQFFSSYQMYMGISGGNIIVIVVVASAGCIAVIVILRFKRKRK